MVNPKIAEIPMTELPILYSFRRCPYAMRARLAVFTSGQRVELREVVLRDKPKEFLDASPKGTVPVLIHPQMGVVEESLDIMDWAVGQNDAGGWRRLSETDLARVGDLIKHSDGAFKDALDRYKYPNRYEGVDPLLEREKGAKFIWKLEGLLADSEFLMGDRFTFADAAILPFVRQFAHVDRDWFFDQDWMQVKRWLTTFIESGLFKAIMEKYPQWKAGDDPLVFGQVVNC